MSVCKMHTLCGVRCVGVGVDNYGVARMRFVLLSLIA